MAMRLHDLDACSILRITELLSVADLTKLLATGSMQLRHKTSKSQCIRDLHALDGDDVQHLQAVLNSATFRPSFQHVTCIKVDHLLQCASNSNSPLAFELASLPSSLTKLSAPRHSLSIEKPVPVAFKALHTLKVSMFVAEEVDIFVKSLLPNVTALTLGHWMRDLGISKSLITDDLTKLSISGRNWNDLSSCSPPGARVWYNLQSLSLQGVRLDASAHSQPESWPSVETCPLLEKLELNVVADACYEAMRMICGLPRLRHLKFHFLTVTDCFPKDMIAFGLQFPSTLKHLEVVSRIGLPTGEVISIPLLPLLPPCLERLVLLGCLSSDIGIIVQSRAVARIISDRLFGGDEAVRTVSSEGEIYYQGLHDMVLEECTHIEPSVFDRFELVKAPRHYATVLEHQTTLVSDILLRYPSIGYGMVKHAPSCIGRLQFESFCNWLAHATTSCTRDMSLLCQWTKIALYVPKLTIGDEDVVFNLFENAVRAQHVRSSPTMFNLLLRFIAFCFTDTSPAQYDQYDPDNSAPIPADTFRARAMEHLSTEYGCAISLNGSAPSFFIVSFVRYFMKQISESPNLDDVRRLVVAVGDTAQLDAACRGECESCLFDDYPMWRAARILSDKLASVCQYHIRWMKELLYGSLVEFIITFVLPSNPKLSLKVVWHRHRPNNMVEYTMVYEDDPQQALRQWACACRYNAHAAADEICQLIRGNMSTQQHLGLEQSHYVQDQ